MPFVLGCAALFFPRVIFLLVWLFGGGYMQQAFEHWVWPLLGFLFLPLTALAYAFSFASLGEVGEVPPMGWILIILAILTDVGVLGGGGARARRRKK